MTDTVMNIGIYLYIFIIGAVVGSFVNVVIYRLPNELSIIKPRSHCPICNYQLTWKQLIPIASYWFQKGKCTNCQKSISYQYPLIEAITGLLYILIFGVIGYSWLTLIYWMLAACFVAIFMIDIEHMIIPDEINLLIFLVGITSSIIGITLPITEALIGSAVGGGILWLIAILSRGGMGGGDIKFAFAVGLFIGWELILLMFFVASFIGSLYGIYYIIRNGYQKGVPIPFGPFLVIAALIVLLWGAQFLQMYFALLIS